MFDIKDYSPDLETLCRLCLEPDKGTINIFESGQLSIPVRIMACAALEIQSTDGLPKLICEQCRLQLEKSYYFRKKCQNSDGKLRKHIRLLNAGKKSKVFLKSNDDDDDDEAELQFEESLRFIREEEIKLEMEEEMKRSQWMKETQEQLRKEDEENRLRWMEKEKEKFRKEETQRLFEEFGQFVSSRKPTNPNVSVKDENIVFEVKEVVSLNAKPETLTQKKCKPRVKVVPRKRIERSIEAEPPENEITSSDQLPDEQEQILIYNEEEGEHTDGTIQTFFLYEKNIEEDSGQLIEIQSENLDTLEDNLNANDQPYVADGGNLDMDVNDDDEGDDDYLFASEYADCGNQDDEDDDRVQSFQIEENGDIHYLKDEQRTETLSISDEDDENQNMLTNTDTPQYNIEQDIEMPTTMPKQKLKRKTSDSESSSQQEKKQPTPTSIITVNYAKISTEDLKIFKCSECPQSFTRENSLLRHASAHKKGRGYCCDKCEKMFSCKSSLDRHIRIHTGEKPFTCHQCGKSYMQKEVLKRHLAIHSGERPHQCPHCPRGFVQKLMLTQHINATHLAVPQIQKHDCHMCSKSFHHASGLSRHLITHSGMKFRCSECGRSFNDKSSIRRHVMSVHSKAKDMAVIEATRPAPKTDQNDSSSE